MINILLWMGCSIKSTVELRNTKKAYESAQMSVYGDFYEDVVRNERVPNAVKKYINREVLYELSYANSQLQKSWEEYAAAEYQSSLMYTEKAQVHIDKALQLHEETIATNRENSEQPAEETDQKRTEEIEQEESAEKAEQESVEETAQDSVEETEQESVEEIEQDNSDQENSE